MNLNRFRIPLYQIRRENGSLDFSKNCAQRGEYFINEIEFNNFAVRQADTVSPINGVDPRLHEKVADIANTGAVVDMSAKTFIALTPLLHENITHRSGQPLQTPYLHIVISDDHPIPYVAASSGTQDVRRFVSMSGDKNAVLPVAIFVEENGVLLTADELTQGMLHKINNGLFTQNHDGDMRYCQRGPLFSKAMVSIVGYEFEARPSMNAISAPRPMFG